MDWNSDKDKEKNIVEDAIMIHEGAATNHSIGGSQLVTNYAYNTVNISCKFSCK